MTIQVVTSTGNVLWTTDRVEISAGNQDVTFQVSVVQLTYTQYNGNIANATMSTPTGNLYSNAIVVGSNSSQQFYVGAGNYLNILSGTNFSATAIGTASSATAGVNGI